MRVWPLLLAIVGLSMLPVASAAAQRNDTWNDSTTMALVHAATARRAAQLADTGLRDYTARANGFINFLARMGDGVPLPPALIKSDQLAVEVYWAAPNLSKQRIIGRRDTLLMPTDQQYHRDHLGIIQNNFPETIRLGDGDEVSDVPHPLSALGLRTYDYRIEDSLFITTANRAIDVLVVSVKPKDDRAAAAVGAVYLERQTASVVRLTFSFTRAALLDEQLEDVSIILENGLVDGRFWLPRRQEIEIRRSVTWMDFPVTGIIRGRWEICCITTNTSPPPQTFVGPEIVDAPAREQRAFVFEGSILDALPEDSRALDAEEVRAVQEEARRLVREAALARARKPTISARRVSDFVRFNRVEGLALGAGLSQQLPNGFRVSGGGRYGFSDYEWKGRGGFEWRSARGHSFSATWFDDFRDVGLVDEVSGLRNSIAAQEFGSDWTDPVGTRGFSARATRSTRRGVQTWLDLTFAEERPLGVNAAPASGFFGPTVLADSIARATLTVGQDWPMRFAQNGLGFRASWSYGSTASWGYGSGPLGHASSTRALLDVEVVAPIGSNRMLLRSIAGAATNDDPTLGIANRPPLQDLIYFGGPISGPGYDYHSLAGLSGVSQRIEYQGRIPFVPMDLGRFGRVPSSLVLAPFVHGVWIGRPIRGDAGWHPSVGLGVIGFFDLVRVDVARGLRSGTWTFSLDISRDFWPVL